MSCCNIILVSFVWLDGISQSDNEELKERTLKALSYSLKNDYSAAIDELENILRVCIPSPTEKMSVLLNLRNAYYFLCQYDSAFRNYEAILELAPRVDEESALEGECEPCGQITCKNPTHSRADAEKREEE